MAAFFTDDLLLEILTRLPDKSIYRFKCVSAHWLSLIDHLRNCGRLSHPMAGFVYTFTTTTTTMVDDSRYARITTRDDLRFFDVLGSHRPPPSFAFLPEHKGAKLLDGCNGLLLCSCTYYFADTPIRYYADRYVVCNPATQQCEVLPSRLHPAGEVGTVRLGFDAAVSPHFYVFAILLGNHRYVTGVEVYSSETKRWVHKDSSGSCQPMRLSVQRSAATVFLNGSLHFCGISSDWACRVAVVDTKGETWTSYHRPKDLYDGFIQMSQGKMHYACFAKDGHGGDDDIRLDVYVMDDYGSKEWTIKHSMKASDILEGMHVNTTRSFRLAAIHPDCWNLIYFTVGRNSSLLVCYNISSRQAKMITDDLGSVRLPYVPYVPMYSELQSLHM